MCNVPSCLQWSKEYLYFNGAGTLSTKSLNWFQRVFRVLGFYGATRLSSIAKSCLQPRIWNDSEKNSIKQLLGRVNRLPPIIWDEQFQDGPKRVFCTIDRSGLIFEIKRVSLFFQTVISTCTVYYNGPNSDQFSVYMNANDDSQYFPKVLVKMAANSLRLKNVYWASQHRADLSTSCAEEYGFQYDSTSFSAKMYVLNQQKAATLAQAYPLTTSYALDFFA